MTKKEIFDNILSTTADVCSVSSEDIIIGARTEDVVTARSIVVFWLNAAGFSTESILQIIGRNNANSINSIKYKIETMWVQKYSYHILIKEVGERLLSFAKSIGEEFDMFLPINKMRKATGKY